MDGDEGGGGGGGGRSAILAEFSQTFAFMFMY